MSHPRAEVEAAVARYVETRRCILEEGRPWSDLAQHFTDDVVFVDPAWGRMEGLEAVSAEAFGSAMDGIDWTFPIDFTMVDGDTAVIKWRQVMVGAGGETREQSGVSTLVYAGGGRFRYEEDLLNMTHVMEDLRASGWKPPEGVQMSAPPAEPNRDFSIPQRS